MSKLRMGRSAAARDGESSRMPKEPPLGSRSQRRRIGNQAFIPYDRERLLETLIRIARGHLDQDVVCMPFGQRIPVAAGRYRYVNDSGHITSKLLSVPSVSAPILASICKTSVNVRAPIRRLQSPLAATAVGPQLGDYTQCAFRAYE